MSANTCCILWDHCCLALFQFSYSDLYSCCCANVGSFPGSRGFSRIGKDRFMSPVRNSPACSYVLATYSAIHSVVVVNKSWLLLGRPLSYTASSKPSTELLNRECGVRLCPCPLWHLRLRRVSIRLVHCILDHKSLSVVDVPLVSLLVIVVGLTSMIILRV